MLKEALKCGSDRVLARTDWQGEHCGESARPALQRVSARARRSRPLHGYIMEQSGFVPAYNCLTQRRFACHPARCKMLWCAKIQRYALMGKAQNEVTEARRMDMPPLRRRLARARRLRRSGTSASGSRCANIHGFGVATICNCGNGCSALPGQALPVLAPSSKHDTEHPAGTAAASTGCARLAAVINTPPRLNA